MGLLGFIPLVFTGSFVAYFREASSRLVKAELSAEDQQNPGAAGSTRNARIWAIGASGFGIGYTWCVCRI